MPDPYFYQFSSPVNSISLPEKFTFPFSYDPHPLTLLAAKELQSKLKLAYNSDEISGKMYGVLVVLDKNNNLGYLNAFSGQLEDHKKTVKFVPSVHNRLEDDGFFKEGEQFLISINDKIDDLYKNNSYLQAKNALEKELAQADKELKAQQTVKHLAKMERKKKRESARTLMNESNYAILDSKLKDESISQHYTYRKLFEHWKMRIASFQEKLDDFDKEIFTLKEKRKRTSGRLQQMLFDQYQFLNARKEIKNLADIFQNTGLPPAGAGDCSAPKLLQYAYENDYQPLAMAEFWWGKTPKGELRKQGRFYPSCSKKCKPILGHMLEGLKVEDDPMLTYTPEGKNIAVIYEDDVLLIIDKPAGLLTTPSRAIKDSVYSRMRTLFPKATGPLVAHRLDKPTSGLMIIAKSKEIYTQIQRQFIEKSVRKRYIAVLEGYLKTEAGQISLPLAIDEDNRPMQKVCLESGRSAQTEYKIIERRNKKTLVEFVPLTGRTHQLRVHSAHYEGLNSPIVGDKLYGSSAERLMLHAASIEFKHPVTEELVRFNSEPDFGLN